MQTVESPATDLIPRLLFLLLFLWHVTITENAANKSRITTLQERCSFRSANEMEWRRGHGRRRQCNRLIPFNPRVSLRLLPFLFLFTFPRVFLMQRKIVACERLQRTDDLIWNFVHIFRAFHLALRCAASLRTLIPVSNANDWIQFINVRSRSQKN